jgi:ribonuclease BN (tRNA processing enzyme)
VAGRVTIAITVLGASGSYPSPGGACSGYLVEGAGTRLWLDAGSGTFANLQRHLPDLGALDGIILSHAHPDHWADVLGYQVVVRYIKKRKGVPTFGPPDLRVVLEAIHGPVGPHLDWTSVSDGMTATVGGLGLTFSRTDHQGETYAVRIDAGGASVGYSADTGTGWSLSALGPGLDLALCEATLEPDDAGSIPHLTAAEAGTTAKEAGVRRLVLTHFQPGVDVERAQRLGSEAFGAPVEVAVEGACFEVGS